MISDAAQHRWALDEGTFRLWLPITILFAIWWNLKLSLHASQMMKARRAFFTRIPSEFVEIATPSGLQMDRLSATTKSARHAMLMLLPPVILVTAVGASPATSIMIW
ncbi:hypothetical protein DFS34DRAFT_63978 [Phlyctochytrium arcticum]|nr:hypothetical protein DFS34DRAFT_63978 [Phlyctochytrium arcticum]